MEIKDPKIIKLLQEKDELVTIGRKVSVDIEQVEKKILKCENEERKITLKVQPVELEAQAEAMKIELNKKIKEFEKVAAMIRDIKLKAIPEKLETEHRAYMAEKEKLERERNKIALKVQKIKDKVIPMIGKIVKPTLKEFEDIESAVVEKDVVKIKIYSKLDEWKENYYKRTS
jgi:hypothetical protein